METLSGSKPRLFFMGLFCNGPFFTFAVNIYSVMRGKMKYFSEYIQHFVDAGLHCGYN